MEQRIEYSDENMCTVDGVAYIAVDDIKPDTCYGCDLEGRLICHRVQCAGRDRTDRRSVIWVKTDNKDNKDNKDNTEITTMHFPMITLTDDMSLKTVKGHLEKLYCNVRNVELFIPETHPDRVGLRFSYRPEGEEYAARFIEHFVAGKLILVKTPWGIKDMSE